MQRNARKPDLRRPRPSPVGSGNETKQVRQVHTRKVPYKVGYSWNKGGRLKELRIRHLARKFLKIWIQNTFGRVLPHKARSHYNSVVLRQAFAGWKEEWWTSRREWSLTMRAECHYRYYLCNVTFRSWRAFLSLCRRKRNKVQSAQSFADRQGMRLVWDRWELFTEMRRTKNRMLESALELNRFGTLYSTWSLWQIRLQQHLVLYTLEKQTLKQRELTLQRTTWLRWKEMHTMACCQKEKESKATLHFILRLKRKMLHHWETYVAHVQTKKKLQALAQCVCRVRLVRTFWRTWSSALHHKWREEDRSRAIGFLAVQSTQRRALEHWKAYVTLCRTEQDRNKTASQHHHRRLLRAGLLGLSHNVTWNKTQRLNNNIAVQHYCQTVTSKSWRRWQDRLEEAEDRDFQALREMALTKHSTFLLSSCFNLWREKLAEQRHMRELEHRADIWFAERRLPLCFNMWVDFTLQRRLHEQRRRKAQVYNLQRQYAWVFYTWWEQAEKHKEQMLSERIAIVHEEQCRSQRAWRHWTQRTEQRIHEKEKQTASDRLYLYRLLHKTMTQWKDNSSEIRDRRERELLACRQGDLCCMRWAVEKWKQFVRKQRVQKSRLEQMQRYHDAKLLKSAFMAWKKHHLQLRQICHRAEELHRRQEEISLRKALLGWRENADLLAEARLMEQHAQSHFQRYLQHKVFLGWREATARAVPWRHQQGEAVIMAQRSINQVRLLQCFGRWRKEARDSRTERMCTDKARRHHEAKLLSKALKAWNDHHNQYHRKKVMKRQGILLLRLKTYQRYFEQWQIKLQRRRREAEQTERALWHWSLTLQAKVLYGWRLWVAEQRRKQEQAARAAQVYRDQLLREGVTCILTYAAHMNDLTTSLTQHGQEHKWRRLQRVVRSCAMRWKQRALCKPRRELEAKGPPPKKSVTFCLATPGLEGDSPPVSAEQEDDDEEEALRKLPLNPCRHEDLLESPLKINTHKQSVISSAEAALGSASSRLHPVHVPVTATRHTHLVLTPQETQDVLLPPSAFMSSRSEDPLEKSSSTGSNDRLQQPSAYQDVRVRASSGETAAMDPTPGLMKELLSIQLDMKTYHQDRKQLQTWQKLRGVLQGWLQTSGKDDQMEKNAVCQELKELEERIDRLSAELATRKPTMLLHAERIRHLRTVLTDLSV